MFNSSSTDRVNGSERQHLLGSASPSYDGLSGSTTNHPPNASSPEVSPGLKPLSWSSAYILVVSRVIGSGVFATPGSIVKSAGSIGLSLSLWAIGTILSGCGMVVFMEYGCMLPRSGGEKVCLEYAYPRPRFLASTLIAIKAVLLSFTASNCIVFAKYTLFVFTAEPTEHQHKMLAVCLLTLVTIIHGCFLKTGIFIQNMLGWVKIFLIIAMSFTGMWVILRQPLDGKSYHAGTRTPFAWDTLWEGSNWSWSLISTSLFKVLYSYGGLNNANNVLGEVQDPIRTLKTVCPAALITASGLYFLANISYFLVIPLHEIKESGELIAGLLFERLFGPQVGRVVFPLAVALSVAGNVMVVTFALARVNQEIARQGFLPWARLLSSSRPFNTPLGGLIVHYVPSVLVILLPPQGDAYNFILDVESYPQQIFILAIAVGLIVIRKREPFRKPSFKAWRTAIWLRIIVCVALLAAPFFPPPGQKGDVHFFYATYAVVGAGLIFAGIIYWYVWTVFLPRRGGYSLEEKSEMHEDGTVTQRLVRCYGLT